MSSLILRDWKGKKIRQRADGFMSLTDMCQAEGKLFADWNRLKATKEYLEVLKNRHYGNSHSEPIEVNEGGSGENKGTWGDRRVAMRLAQWLSADFAIQVDEWVVELMTTGTVTIADSPTPEPIALRPAIERVEALHQSLAFFGIDPQNPRFKQGLQDLVGDTLGLGQASLPGSVPVEKWYGVVERADQLGIPAGLVTKHRSQLGKVVKVQIDENDRVMEERLCNGTMRDICLYRASAALDAAIESFFAIKAVA